MESLERLPIEEKKMINECLASFDFAKVHKVMEQLNWQWNKSISETGVPTIGELYQKAENLLYDCSQSYGSGERCYYSCGGFMAERVPYDEDSNDIEYKLYFILEES